MRHLRTHYLTYLLSAFFVVTSHSMEALPFDAGILRILSPASTQCGGEVLPVIILRNYGTDQLKEVLINYTLDGNLIANYSWTGNLPPGGLDTISFPQLMLDLGSHTLIVETFAPNGFPDTGPFNDKKSITFEILVDQGVPVPYLEGFDGGNFPSNGLTIVNPDTLVGWSATNTASRYGNSSIFMDNYNYNAIGQVDELVLPGLDLSTLPKSALNFFVAYALYGPNSGFSDTLEVWASGDCGVSFDLLFRKYGSDLATSSPTTEAFIPQEPWQWRKESIDLSPYSGSSFVVIRFRHTTNYENNLYLDQIRVNELFNVGVEEIENIRLAVFPNPASEKFSVIYEGNRPTSLRITVSDLTGRKVLQRNISGVSQTHRLEIPVVELEAGMYLAEIQDGQHKLIRKLLIE